MPQSLYGRTNRQHPESWLVKWLSYSNSIVKVSPCTMKGVIPVLKRYSIRLTDYISLVKNRERSRVLASGQAVISVTGR
jgi:hypothetical protein